MNQGSNAWWNIKNALRSTCGDELDRLLNQSEVSYDGMLEIATDDAAFPKLCQYYPVIEAVADDVAGVRVKLRNISTVPVGTDSESLQLILGYANVAEAIIRPESIAAVPSYSLRFIPYVGSAPVLIAIALRQAFYRAFQDEGLDNVFPKAGDTVTVNVAALLHSLGGVISRAKFFRLFKEGKLDWFAARSEAEHTFKDGRIHRLPNTYQYKGLLLTPGDASDLLAWLQDHGIQDNPVDALTEALRTSRDQILQFPYRTPSSAEHAITHAASVHEVVSLALAGQALNSVLAGICDSLSSHLIRPESFLAIPWYWFRKVLPELGDDLGALYLMAKNCCYVDWAHGQDRNTFWVPGGLKTLQAWIGSVSLPKRIPQKDPTQRGRPRSDDIKDNSEYVRSWRDEKRELISHYLCRIDTRRSDSGLDWQLEVNDTQLTASDYQIQDAVYHFVDDCVRMGNLDKLQSLLSGKNSSSLLQKSSYFLNHSSFCNYETLVNAGICNSDTLEPHEISYFDTLVRSIICNFDTLVRQDICNFDTVINILYRLKNTLLSIKYKQPPDTAHKKSDFLQETGQSELTDQVVEAYYSNNSWDIEQILNRINPVLSKQIQQRFEPESFVSWLIYGCLTPGIKSPMSFAVSRALESGLDAGGAALRLANLPPKELSQQLWQAKVRLEAGYLGDGFLTSTLASDLSHFLKIEENTNGKLFLIQRLLDVLGIKAN